MIEIAYNEILGPIAGDATLGNSGQKMHTFKIAGTIKCTLTRSQGGTMQFNARAGCENGLIPQPYKP